MIKKFFRTGHPLAVFAAVALVVFVGFQLLPRFIGRNFLGQSGGGVCAPVIEATYPVVDVNGGALAEGPDGNMWFTAPAVNRIGRIKPDGTTDYFPIPTANALPYNITSAPDGHLWFSENGGTRVAKISTAGVITEFPALSLPPSGIAATADGTIWVVEGGLNILKISASNGTVLARYPVPPVQTGVMPAVSSITAGPDGKLWFTDNSASRVGVMTTAGVFNLYSTPSVSSQLESITTGPDGNIWFVGRGVGASMIGKVTPEGSISVAYQYPDAGATYDIAAGLDGNLWITHGGGNASFNTLTTGGAIGTPFINGPTSYRALAKGPGLKMWAMGANTILKIKLCERSSGVACSDNADNDDDGKKDYPFDVGCSSLADNNETDLQCIPSSPSLVSYMHTGQSAAFDIVGGGDGNLWFTHLGRGVSKMTPSGVSSYYPLTTVPFTGTNGPAGITEGPDGNIWLVEEGASRIVRITPAGVETAFPLDTSAQPVDIVTGPDGHLWFTKFSGIGRISVTGDVVEFSTPGLLPKMIVAGSDGNLWFTDAAGKFGRVTPGGAVTSFPGVPGVIQRGLAVGSDGNFWFTGAPEKIFRMTPAGSIMEFAVPGEHPKAVTAGPDGNLWFTTEAGNVGKITATGVVTMFAQNPPLPGAFSITQGPDGNIWFVGGNSIHKFSVCPGGSAGLLAHYTFDDGTGKDVTGNGHDAANNGATPLNGCMDFNGTSSFLENRNGTGLPAGNDARSVTYWFRDR